MDIKLNLNLGPVPLAAEGQVRARSLRRAVSDTEFSSSAALDQALQHTPNVRPEVVARARSLVAEQKYPPEETVKRIANLLAIHLGDET